MTALTYMYSVLHIYTCKLIGVKYSVIIHTVHIYCYLLEAEQLQGEPHSCRGSHTAQLQQRELPVYNKVVECELLVSCPWH